MSPGLHSEHVFKICLLLLVTARPATASPGALGGEPIHIGTRLELFTDDYLVQDLHGASLRLHEPTPAGVVLKFDRPWEGSFSAYITVIQDDDRFRMYYRGLSALRGDNSTNEVTCYAESKDGVTWTKPSLQLFEAGGTRENNIVLAGDPPFSSNFAPLLDTRPGVPPEQRFKALAGSSKTGLYVFVSADGLHWRKLQSTPVLKGPPFDSQNVAFWSEREQCYCLYYRTWSGGGFNGIRTISRSTSPDFLNWSPGQEMAFGDSPREHFYTSQTQPYFRAPHLYVATPMRFLPGRKVLSDEQAQTLGVKKGYAGDCADVVLLTSRGSNVYHRAFMEAFIRPGPDPGNWASRAALTARGIVPTGPAELSVYKQAHYAQPSAHLVRYALRTDGFISVNAGYKGGEMTTKPLIFSGAKLSVNFATSAVGYLKLELQDSAGTPLPGYTAADCEEIVGDSIARIVSWQKGADLSALAGKPVRLRFVLKDCDLYALQFHP